MPIIVCLCGSTKFKKEFEKANLMETLKGNIVLSVGCFTHSDNIPITKEQKTVLDLLHLDKIDMANEVLVINPENYIGLSTANEIKYAQSRKKKIRYFKTT